MRSEQARMLGLLSSTRLKSVYKVRPQGMLLPPTECMRTFGRTTRMETIHTSVTRCCRMASSLSSCCPTTRRCGSMWTADQGITGLCQKERPKQELNCMCFYAAFPCVRAVDVKLQRAIPSLTLNVPVSCFAEDRGRHGSSAQL